MSFWTKLFQSAEHEAQPLLSAAMNWAETDGLKLVAEVRTEIKSLNAAQVITLFNTTVGPALGFLVPEGSALSQLAEDLLLTALTRAKAAATTEAAKLRTSVINAGIEQAVLLAKARAGDTSPAPALAPA